ncbi:hypothetical protein LINPERPRIM_LOCUS36549, partial [Linum perenne]
MKTNLQGTPPHFTKRKKISNYIAPCSIGRAIGRKPQPFSSLTSLVNPTSGIQ